MTFLARCIRHWTSEGYSLIFAFLQVSHEPTGFHPLAVGQCFKYCFKNERECIIRFKNLRQSLEFLNLIVRHFHIDNNATCPPPTPKKKKKKMHNYCFQFLLGTQCITVIPRQIEDDGCARFWGVNNVHYGLCEK